MVSSCSVFRIIGIPFDPDLLFPGFEIIFQIIVLAESVVYRNPRV
jgi:hypothetical protein